MAAKRERAAPVIHDDGFMINGCMFHVDPKYKPIDAIGQGSYGVVCSVRNTDSSEKLAIKKITPMAGDEWDATHTLREIRLMRCLGAHENIISLKDLSMREDKDELYMMMELADTDLHRLIQSSCPLTEGHIRVIMFQILSGVKAMHDNGVLHRDLKPGNLLLNKDCELKITDFGLARMIPRDQANDSSASMSADSVSASSVVSPMTEYVVTRWYRPPELMLAPNGCYDGAVDMWSVGCILGELVSRKPMFPGTDFMDQLTRVFKVVTIPDKDQRGYVIEKDALKFLQSLPPTQDNAVEKHFKNAPPLALDLMKKLLCFNPKERLSAEEALAHPFFEGVKDEWGEITELKLGHSLEFAFEQQSLPLSTLRQYICEEVRAFRERDDADRKKQSEHPESTSGAESASGSSKASTSSNQQHGSIPSDAAKQASLRVVNDMPAGRGFTLKGCDFNVPPQYKPLQVLGEGSYGIVCAATDTTTKVNVAIKKITPMAGDEWDAKHTLREIRLMRYFGHHPNIASLQNLSTCTEKDELYLMMDLVDTDLHRLIQSKTKLEEAHTAAIMYQLLCGAKVLHENGVLHRDLKPGNILVSKNCDVKITDFGLSRYIPHGGRGGGPSAKHASHEKGKDLMTEYVVTRWYRAPEIMLAPNGTYGEAVDMWSIGCIFGELLNRKPMFPGSDFIDQLTRVFSVLPVPAADKRGYHVEGDAQKFLESLPACSPDAITKLFRKASAEAVSLLRRLLCVNPERRITAKQALAHPYFKNIRAQLGEPPEFQVAKAFDFEFDYLDIPLANLRQLIQDEVKLLQHDRLTESSAPAKKEPVVEAEKKTTGPHEKEVATAQHTNDHHTKKTSPSTAAAKPAAHHSHKQQDESDDDDQEDDEDEEEGSAMSKETPLPGPSEFLTSKAKQNAGSNDKHREQKPESDDHEPVVTKKAPADPQDDNDDEEEEQAPEEIIQVERTRRPASGKLERPRSATGTAASAAAARRAAATSTHRDNRDEDHHHSRQPTSSTSHRSTASSSSSSTGNNESSERWGHPRPITTTRPTSTVTSSGATAILKKSTPTHASAAAASRLLSSSRTSSLASTATTTSASNQTSSSSLHSVKDSEEKSDAYRHPERATASSSSSSSSTRLASSRTGSSGSGLGASASTKEILPDGWVKKIHSKSGREYYYDTLNKVSSWKHPSKMDNIFGNNSHTESSTTTSRVAKESSSSSSSRRTISSTSGTKEPTISTSSSSSLVGSGGPSSGSSKEASTLPKDWERRTDPKTGRLFYVNLVTKKAFARLPSSVSAAILTTSRDATTIKKSAAISSHSSTNATIDAALKKKTSTVPQSPAFSQMSWQKKTPTARSTAATGDE